MTPTSLLTRIQQSHQTVRYCLNEAQTAIGAWNKTLGRYQIVAMLAITGEWVTMPYEVFLNGQPPLEKWATQDTQRKDGQA
jgi:hypothetical protein